MFDMENLNLKKYFEWVLKIDCLRYRHVPRHNAKQDYINTAQKTLKDKLTKKRWLSHLIS